MPENVDEAFLPVISRKHMEIGSIERIAKPIRRSTTVRLLLRF
jgi:hypothetical protein